MKCIAAVQAYGAGNMAAMPVLFQRCLYFMLAHGAPMLLLIVFLPQGLRLMGQPLAVCKLVAPYRWGLAAALPLEVLNRSELIMLIMIPYHARV